MITPLLLQTILKDYALHLDGIHGVAHWARVLENGRKLTAETGARLAVVELFAVFHDSRRVNDGSDRGHGRRGAELAKSLRGTAFELDDTDFDLLFTACSLHTDGLTGGDITLLTCWDADRLDLLRAGVPPVPWRMGTAAARHAGMISWASQRSLRGVVPELVREEWGMD